MYLSHFFLKRLLGLGSILITLLLNLSCTKPSELRLNQIQIIGTHNSYHLRPSREILETRASLDYGHAPLTAQLEAGVRSFAIDIYQSNEAFRVLHVPRIDEGSNCETFDECLGEIVAWSNENPEHIPLIVFIEVKHLNQAIDDLTPMTTDGIEELESLLWMKIGEDKLLTPDKVRGTESSLEKAVLTTGWPLLDSVRGQIMVVLNAPERLQAYYTTVSPSLKGRAMFVKTEPGHPEAAVVVSRNAESQETADWIEKGYLVRFRADTGAKEARTNDLAKRDSGLANGCHIITTDFPSVTPHPETGYAVALEDGKSWRVNPVTGGDYKN